MRHARDDFERPARTWCADIVQTGRDLDVVDQELPLGLPVEVVWSIPASLKRWLALHTAAATDGAGFPRILLTCLLGSR